MDFVLGLQEGFANHGLGVPVGFLDYPFGFSPGRGETGFRDHPENEIADKNPHEQRYDSDQNLDGGSPLSQVRRQQKTEPIGSAHNFAAVGI